MRTVVITQRLPLASTHARRPPRAALALTAALSLVVSSTAHAAFHEMLVAEVFAGSPAHPNAHYIELVMVEPTNEFVSGHVVEVYDASGALLEEFTFGGNGQSPSQSQDRFWVASDEAVALFSLNRDLQMTAIIPRDGGAVCFPDASGGDDCVAWGNFSVDGGALDGNVPVTPFPDALGDGLALTRRSDLGASGAAIENSGDDTDQSNVDFSLQVPTPTNNIRQNG